MKAAEVEWTAMPRVLADSLLIRYNDIGCSLGPFRALAGHPIPYPRGSKQTEQHSPDKYRNLQAHLKE